ncbi:MAG: ATP-binding protein [Acidobacteria bacterium]|nr:ATP-binding protein [Acidobacteriota bacterium]
MIYPVHTVDDAYSACHPDIPLQPGDKRFVDLTKARGIRSNIAKKIANKIKHAEPGRYHHQLVSGHRGCGKSTELFQLQDQLRKDGYFVVYFDVEDVLDLADIRYQDVLVAITKAIEKELSDAKIEIDAGLRENLDQWFAEKILISEQKVEGEASLKTEFGIDSKLPLLARALAMVTSHLKASSNRRSEIRRRLDNELGDFIERLNVFIGNARNLARDGNFHDLVVIVDGLEKMHYREEDGTSNQAVLFIRHADQLKSPDCHIIYTLPIFLAFNVNLGHAYSDELVILPMVNQNNEEGINALHQVVSSRVAIEDVFENPASVNQLIAMCGGSVRDLLRLVRLSADNFPDKISDDDVEDAIRRMAKEFDRILRDEDLPTLARISKTQRLSGEQSENRLLNLRLVHEYENGERWADVHPMVRKLTRMREFLAENSDLK